MTDKIGSFVQYTLLRISRASNDSSNAPSMSLHKGDKISIKVRKIDPKIKGVEVGLVQNTKTRQSFSGTKFTSIDPNSLNKYFSVGEVKIPGYYVIVFKLNKAPSKEVSVIIDEIKID